MAILNAGIVAPTGGYQISRSLRFNSADSAYLNRTPASAGNRTTWTWSGWVKRGGITLSSNTPFFSAGTSSSEFSMFYVSSTTDRLTFYTLSGGVDYGFQTSAVLRDPSAWYHLMCVYDSTNGTASNRLKLYINGVQYTDKATDYGDIPLNHQTFINATNEHLTGKYTGNTQYLNGYLTEINFIDGQALTPSSFGETDTDTGVWKPKKYTGTYGTNGFYLNFSDNSGTTSTTLGKDYSGNGNNWTPNNFSVTAGAGNDSLVDTPTNYGTDTGVGGEVRGNYCTLNPLNTTGGALSNGNLDYVNTSTTSYFSVAATMALKGKMYWELTVPDSTTPLPGIVGNGTLPAAGGSDVNTLGGIANGYGLRYTKTEFRNNNTTIASGLTSYSNGDVLSFAYDSDTGKLWYAVNGTWQASGNPSAGTNPIATTSTTIDFFPAIAAVDSGSANFNFGQRPFAYTAPSGFKALCTQNLPEPTIKDGGDYFNTILYTGTGSSNARTGVGFQPDFVWIKGRSGATDHGLYDAVRGVQKQLETNNTGAETTETTGLTAFGSDGFTVGALAQLNTSSATYVAWNWKANGAGSSNTAGTITSTVSVNTTSGFSIVTYTGNGTAGATVGHGLGVTPALIIVKRRDGGTNSWNVQHQSVNYNSVLFLDLTSAATVNSNFNSTGPTSSVFYLGSSDGTNGSGGTKTYVAYCFAPVAGYSAMSSFTGNGSADGPFIFTNHRPAFVLIKRTDTTSNWTIIDFQREGYNVDNDPLFPNLSDAETTTDLADLLSNGFKLRTTDASVNASGGTYIYMSLASNPFKFSLAR